MVEKERFHDSLCQLQLPKRTFSQTFSYFFLKKYASFFVYLYFISNFAAVKDTSKRKCSRYKRVPNLQRVN